jgi:hypothetical protein
VEFIQRTTNKSQYRNEWQENISILFKVKNLSIKRSQEQSYKGDAQCLIRFRALHFEEAISNALKIW